MEDYVKEDTMGIKDAFSKITKKVKSVTDKVMKDEYEFDVSTKEAREAQAFRDYEDAKTKRMNQKVLWQEMEDYYNGHHYSAEQLIKLQQEKGWDFEPPCLTDPYIQVESQIDVNIPQFQFKGRDNDLDPERAKIREEVCKYVCHINRLERLNVLNERRLNKYGTAVWKVSFDGSIQGPGYIGDIVIGNPSPANIFPDPSAYDIDSCEYVFYSYRMHRRAARRKWGKVIDHIGADGNHSDTEIFREDIDPNDDTVQVIEYWYKDGEGDIACSTLVNFVEVDFITKYWENTRKSGNKMFPFIIYSKIPKEESIWGMGEIEAIKSLADASDREFFTGLMNDMFMANDVILQEAGAIADGSEMSSVPGAIVEVNPGKINSVRRLGGVSANGGLIDTIQFIHEKILETNGNFALKGQETKYVTTASGLAQMREDRDSRATVKKADRKFGFQRLYELIDWTALEFYNTTRVFVIYPPEGAENKTPQQVPFNSQNMAILDDRMTALSNEPYYYYPMVDVEITAGDGIEKSKAFTLAASQDLAKTQITPANVGIIKSIIDLMDLPNKKELKDSIDSALQQQQAQQEQAAMMKAGIPAEGQSVQQGANVQIPPQVQQLQQVMQQAGLNEQEQATVIQLLQAQDSQQQAEMLNASPDEQLAVIKTLLGGK